tara:strand:- start:307 stop:642 length:336 start_codon:yes stop_codon:yes gene_type:complete
MYSLLVNRHQETNNIETMFLAIINWWVTISTSAVDIIKICCSKTALKSAASLLSSNCSCYSLEWLETQMKLCKGPDGDNSRNASGQWGHFLDIEMLEEKKEQYVYGEAIKI